MDMQTAIRTVTQRQDLTRTDMVAVMKLIMLGHATPAQIGAFLIGLRMKGETVNEITGATDVMRSLVARVPVTAKHVVDTCGTGGDGSHLFNVSTAAAFVVAAAGGHVAKHGNRSVSSKSGSADVLEAAGVNLELTPDQVARCVNEMGVGFMFAPKHHSAMRYASEPRKEIGARTIFNLLGPLTNPAGAPNQVLGVFAKQWVRPLAEVLKQLGSEHVLVVHAEDGLDEITLNGTTCVAELNKGEIKEYTITPEQFGLKRASLASVQVKNPQESLELVKQALSRDGGTASDLVALNAGAAIYAANLCTSLESGVEMAQDAIGSGLARVKLTDMVNFTQCFIENE
jgi:anthranilate phosphoribosyltransferase